MTSLYPAAQYRPLAPVQAQPPMRAHDIICLHTMVGGLDGTDAYFRAGGYQGTESHFGVGADGTVYQWVDLDYQADANLDGNGRVISIETADVGPEFPKWDTTRDAVPPWRAEQLAPLAELVAWLCDRYAIPCAVIPDSRPGRRGVGWHRLGVDPWRVADGEHWSTAVGKVCPGAARIAQVPGLVAAAAQRLATPRPPDPAREDLAVFPVSLTFYADQQCTRPDPAGLFFRASCAVEAAGTSEVVDRAWVRWVSYWAAATFRIVAWGKTSPIAEANPALDWWELPAAARGFTVEGTRKPGAVPDVRLLVTPK